MKQPTLSQFNNKLNDLISDIPIGKLKEIICSIAGEIQSENRMAFLQKVEHVISGTSPKPGKTGKPELTPAELFKKIENYAERMKNGEFFNEERDYMGYQRDEYDYYRNSYNTYEDDTDFSNEEYVLEMEDLLNGAESTYQQGDIEIALKVYQAIFDIIDDETYEYDEYFFYGFSFSEALGEDNYKNHKIKFLRSFYLNHLELNQTGIFQMFSKQRSIYLSDIVDAENKPLTDFDEFINAYIQYLTNQPGKAMHLVDAVFVKGGIDELQCFAYKKGNEIPALFLAYFTELTERNAKSDEILKIALDGIQIIPEKYASRSILSKEVILQAQKTGDTELLLIGFSTAFYSNPDLINLDAYLGFIWQQSIKEELKKFEVYLNSKTYIFTKREEWSNSYESSDIYSDISVDISKTNYIISWFIFHGLDELIKHKDGSILGFQDEKKHIPVIISLFFVSVSTPKNALIIEMLMDKYCFDNNYIASKNLKQLIYKKAGDKPYSKIDIMQELAKAEKIATDRVRHILKNKLRGGYESSCLLLTACAEAKEIINRSGNRLISDIDNEFKRFNAFRRELKALTKKSSVLITVK